MTLPLRLKLGPVTRNGNVILYSLHWRLSWCGPLEALSDPTDTGAENQNIRVIGSSQMNYH
jgi:hypothetical protein